MAGLVYCDPLLASVLQTAGRCLDESAAELTALLGPLRALGVDTHWRSAAADRFHLRSIALADDVSRLAARAQDAAVVAAATRQRVLPASPWAF